MKKSKINLSTGALIGQQALAQESAQKLSKLGGTMPEIKSVPRRRWVDWQLVSECADK